MKILVESYRENSSVNIRISDFKRKKLPFYSIVVLLTLLAFSKYGRFGDRFILKNGAQINYFEGGADFKVNGSTYTVVEFIHSGNYLVGVGRSISMYEGSVVYWDYSKDKVKHFTKKEYANYARQNRLPEIDNFKAFDYHYDRYYSGIRWFIP